MNKVRRSQECNKKKFACESKKKEKLEEETDA
jgi:hypothetical protein